MIEFEFLNSVHGEARMYIEDGGVDERKKIGAKIDSLLKEGQAIFLIDGNNTRQIRSYDEVTNEWLVVSDSKPNPVPVEVEQPPTPMRRGRGRPPLSRVYAGNSRVTALGQIAGG